MLKQQNTNEEFRGVGQGQQQLIDTEETCEEGISELGEMRIQPSKTNARK